LGKKRHRVETARRLVFGSMVRSYESVKEIYAPTSDHADYGLFRVLDNSLPFWAHRDSWGRLSSVSSRSRNEPAEADNDSILGTFAPVKTVQNSSSASTAASLSDAVQDLARAREPTSNQKLSRIVAV
jgi:hypothetical protein